MENSIDGIDEDKRKGVMERARGHNTDRLLLRLCQVDRCIANLTEAKQYYCRHNKVCEVHAEAWRQATFFVNNTSRFHELPEFDEAKRGCRRRLVRVLEKFEAAEGLVVN